MKKSQYHQTDSEVYNQVLSLLRSSIWGEDRFPYQTPQDTNWKMIHKELKNHSVQFLPLNILTRENPSQNLLYVTADAKNIMRRDKIMQEQQDLCHLLHNNNIPCAIIKGSAAAYDYPVPSHRPLGDIDLLVHPEDFERARHLISEYCDFIAEDFRHIEYKHNGIIIELHRAFAVFKDRQKRELFDKRILDSINKAESLTIDDFTFFRLPKIEHGLILLEHIDNHLESGLGLRQIIDWMIFVDQELTDEVWQSEFSPFLQQINREKLAITITRMCQMYLGLRTDITWCANADETLCRKLIEYILYQGNFGRKNPEGSNRATAFITASGSVFSFFRVLQRIGSENWKLLDHYPFLKPFAWLHQAVRYIRLGLSTEHPIQFLKNAIKRSKSQAEFFEELGVIQLKDKGEK